MSCKPWNLAFLVAATGFALTALIGCTPSKPIYLNDNGDLNYYLEHATGIEYPDVDVPSLEEVVQTHAPITVIDPDFESFFDCSLEQCVGIALQNSQVLRGYGTPSLQNGRVAPGQDNLANGPAAAGTIFNVAIRESEPGFLGTAGQISSPSSITTNTGLDANQGVESALADFDAQFTSSAIWARSNEARNSPVGSPFDPQVFEQDSVQWQSEIAKKTANGTQLFFRQINNYTSNNTPLSSVGGFQVLDSWYRTAFEAEIRQPLLRGRGAFIQRMPIVISRINTDQEIANLDAQMQNVVTNVEIRYWELYAAYRAMDTAKDGRDAALNTWRIVNDQYEGDSDVNIQQVAQAREQYHFFDGQVNTAFSNLLDAEGKLRFLLGLSATDSRIIRPTDDAIMAPIEFDWCEALCEALSFRPELRQERWEIKKRELALAHARNGLLPELNVTALYRWLGNGNRYGTSANDLPFPDQSSGALNELYNGAYQEFQFGGEYRRPIGFRREMANVKNAQLKVAREIARFEDMELDVARELTEAIRALDINFKSMQTNFNRWIATKQEEDHFIALENAGIETLDVALNSQRRRAEAELAFYSALSEYNKVIALIHRRKGTIMAYNSIEMAEGPWAGKAYADAEEHARRRSASRQINYGWTRPQVISRGSDSPAGYYDGASNGVISTDEYGAPMVDEIILDEPYNEEAPIEIIQPELIEQDNSAPTTSPIQGSNSRNMPRNNQVQQVSYDAPVRQARKANVAADAKMQAAPFVAEPPRDLFTRPQQPANMVRVTATSQTANPNSASQPTSVEVVQTLKAKPTEKGAKPEIRSRGLNWEKFGLSNPQDSGSQVKASIKTEIK